MCVDVGIPGRPGGCLPPEHFWISLIERYVLATSRSEEIKFARPGRPAIVVSLFLGTTAR
jgi:hypothetical protein